MKNVISTLIAIFAMPLFISLNAQSNFEGVVHSRNTANEGFVATFTLKGDLAVMETQTDEGKIYILFDGETGDMTNVIHKNEEKVAIKMNMNSNPYLAQMNQNNAKEKRAKDKSAKIEVTDETKMIRGYKCVKVVGSDKEYEGVAWITRDLDLDMTDLIPSAKKYLKDQQPLSEFADIEGFVMEMTSKNLKTGERFTFENEVVEKEIPDSFFTNLTKGVEVFDMTDMRQMMLDAQQNPEKMQRMRELMMKLNEE